MSHSVAASHTWCVQRCKCEECEELFLPELIGIPCDNVGLEPRLKNDSH